MFIPIGHRCNAIDFLRKYDLYTHNSPLDWAILSLEMFVKMHKNNFNDIFDDLYEFKTKSILYQKNKELKPTKIFKYRIFSNNYRQGFLNLNYWDGDYELYDTNNFIIVHYDMNKAEIKSNLQKRLENMLGYENKIYFYVTPVHDNLKIIDYYQNLISDFPDIRFLIVITMNDDLIDKDYVITDHNHIFYILKVQKLEQQYLKRGRSVGENDVKLDKDIDWNGLYNYIVTNYQSLRGNCSNGCLGI